MHRPLHASASMLLVVLATAAVPAVAASPTDFPRLRCLDERAKAVLNDAVRQSLTVRSMVQRIEGSDLVVYLRIGLLEGEMAGNTKLMTATTDTRYVVVTVNPKCIPLDLVPRLGHELRHVLEIAEAPDVRDERGMRALFGRIGWHSGADNWETKSALEAGRRVAREMTGTPSPPS